MSETTGLWDELHHDPKHLLKYPSEHVVRWMAPLKPGIAVDIGCGAGRHTRLLHNNGFAVDSCDASEVPLELFPNPFAVRQAPMTELPFASDHFDYGLAFGVFYYGRGVDHRSAVAELHRVLVPGGKALVVTRTTRDSRALTGDLYDTATRRMTDGDEVGMLINFLDMPDIRKVYSAFGEVTFDRCETTRDAGTWIDSDWLINLTK